VAEAEVEEAGIEQAPHARSRASNRVATAWTYADRSTLTTPSR
jgi:hypothetical protein